MRPEWARRDLQGSRKPSGPSSRSRSRQRRNVRRSETQHLRRLCLRQLAPLMSLQKPLETHLPYPLQHFRPAHSGSVRKVQQRPVRRMVMVCG